MLPVLYESGAVEFRVRATPDEERERAARQANRFEPRPLSHRFWGRDLDIQNIESGILNGPDNCPFAVNPGQENADGDLLGDACDPCPLLPGYQTNDSESCGLGARPPTHSPPGAPPAALAPGTDASPPPR